jgi:nucleoside phosphorylase
MDQILREVQAKRQRAEAAEKLHQERLARWTRLRDAFQAAAGFSMQDYAAELGREPTRDEFYRAWAERLASFGRAIRDHGLVDWVEREYSPASLDVQWTRGMLLRASRTPDDVAGLQELLERSEAEPDLHAVRHRLRDFGDQLLKEASPAMPSDASATPELPRELIQDYLLGKVQLTPEQERQLRGFNPGEAVEVPHPEAEELARWAGIALVRGKFRPGWWELPAACRFWHIPTDGEPNHWLPVIADCMQELFGRLLLEEDLLGYLFRQHRAPPSEATSLSLADLAHLLREDCDRRRTDRENETAPPAPNERLPEAVEDLPAYKAEEQPWWTPLPVPKELRSEDLTALAEKIDIVLMTATDPELEAVLGRLEPYPRRGAVLKGFVEQETYYLGRLGSCLAAVTKCRMGSLDSGAATLATQHAQRVWRPKAVVMVGIALGKDPVKQKIADVLVASQVISYEPQRVGEEQVVPRGPITPASTTLLNRFENVPHWFFCRPDGSKCERHVGPLLSGEKLVDDPAFKAELFRRYPQAIGGEMEGVGLAAAAVRHGVPWILVKAICDWADGKKHKKHQALAAAAAVSLVHHVLSQADVLHGLGKPDQP